jgi:hypothetical protein
LILGAAVGGAAIIVVLAILREREAGEPGVATARTGVVAHASDAVTVGVGAAACLDAMPDRVAAETGFVRSAVDIGGAAIRASTASEREDNTAIAAGSLPAIRVDRAGSFARLDLGYTEG